MTDGPMTDGPMTGRSTADGPMTGRSTADGPMADGPMTDGPTAGEPTADVSTADVSTTDGPMREESVFEESMPDASRADGPGPGAGGQVVVGVDGSLVAVRALDLAAEDALRRGAGLRVVFAVADRDEAAPILASAAARVRERHPGLPVETRAVEGGAVRALARESESALLTVVGTRGFGGVSGLLAGSVSWRLAAQVHSPLLVARGDRADDEGREVLLGLEGDADADAAAHAFREAVLRGARLRVVHAASHRHTTPELPPLITATSPGQERRALRERAEEAVPRFGVARLREEYPGVEVDVRTVRTGPAHALLAGTREAGVVVIGAHRRAGRLGAPVGPVAHVLLHHSHCPVLLVPTR